MPVVGLIEKSCGIAEHSTREEWLFARLAGIGGSEAAAIMGVSPWASPMSVYADKIGNAEPVEETEPMQWGKRLEEPAANAYCEETGRKVMNLGEFTILTSRHVPRAFATLDRLIIPCYDLERNPSPADGPGVLEIKTSRLSALDGWEREPPTNYQIQVQHQMMVSGCKWGSFAVLFGGQTFRWFDFVRNDAFLGELEQAIAEFWGHVTRREPPASDASEATTRALKAIYPRPTIEAVALPPEADEWDCELVVVGEQQDILNAKERELRNKIMAALGPAEKGILSDGTAYTWREQKKKAYAVEASTSRVLRRMASRNKD